MFLRLRHNHRAAGKGYTSAIVPKSLVIPAMRFDSAVSKKFAEMVQDDVAPM